MDSLAKVYTLLLNNRLVAYVNKEKLLQPEQGGFTKGRETTDQVMTLNEAILNRGA